MKTLTTRPITPKQFNTKKELKSALKIHGVGSLLSVDTNAKTVKGQKQGFITGIMYLKPEIKVCPMSKKAGCYDACLVSAGRGKFNSVKNARINRTELMKGDPELFISALISEIEFLQKKHSDSLVIRLNGTSDIDWLRVNIVSPSTGKECTIFDLFPTVQFYDYTKVYNRARCSLPANYDLTLSYSEADSTYASRTLSSALCTGTRVAVVFRNKLPKMFKGFTVIDGDESDLRHLDPHGVVVGLKAKGSAKKDASGFVIDL